MHVLDAYGYTAEWGLCGGVDLILLLFGVREGGEHVGALQARASHALLSCEYIHLSG